MAIIEQIDTDLSQGLIDTATTLSNGAMAFGGPVFRTLVIIYFAVWGYILWTGSVQEPLRDTILRFLRVTAVATVALTAGLYTNYIIGLAFNGPNEILNGITGTNYQATERLDKMWQKMVEYGNQAANAPTGGFGIMDTMRNWVTAITLWLAGIALVLPQFALILLSKVLLTVLLAVGPIFIIASLFKVGVQFTQAWVGQLLSYVFIYLLIMILMHVAADTVFNLIDRAFTEHPDVDIMMALEVVMISGVLLFAVTQIPTLGGSLAGSVSAPIGGILRYIPGPGTATRAFSTARAGHRARQSTRAVRGKTTGLDRYKQNAGRAKTAARMTANFGKGVAKHIP